MLTRTHALATPASKDRSPGIPVIETWGTWVFALRGQVDRFAFASYWRMGEPAPKSCAVCGREIRWRKKWERDWENVRYCSDACRRRAKSGSAGAQDAALETAILALLAERGAGKTICPSEAARRVGVNEDWAQLMEPARAAARRLHAAGRLAILQGGHPVDPSHAKGPIRLKLL